MGKRVFSCRYDKPFFSPFFASALAGFFVTSTIVTAIAAQGVQTRQQLDRMELEIRAIRGETAAGTVAFKSAKILPSK